MKYGFLISHLSLEEKASLLSGQDYWNTKAIPSKGIPSIAMSDGPHGLRKQVKNTNDIPRADNSLPATCFPTASALANSWDEEAVEKTGEYLGKEAAAENVAILLGPGVNIKRNPLCGRNFEYFSEDPFLAGKMGAAMIRGIQTNGISACVKHYAANSQEHLRMSVDSVVDERTLREIYMPAFETAVKEGGVKCVMTSYNKVNGVYAHENGHLIKDVLRGDWGYEGVVVSDWGGNNDKSASIMAGATLEMPSSNGMTDRQIVQAVREGKLAEADIDEQVDRLLTLVFASRKTLDNANKRYDRYKHHMVAADMAAECAVLLKNEDSILPLSKEKTVAVIGDFAEKPRIQGAGSSLVNAWNPLAPLDCLNKELNVTDYAKGFNRNGKRSSKLMKEAVELARKTDVVLLYLGLDEGGESEGVDRETMAIPQNQINLLKVLAQVNENIIVVLTCGGAVETGWDVYCKALVHGYLSGQAGALAVAELLSGKRNFSGKLAETMPFSYSDVPSAPWFPGQEKTAEYREGLYVGYRYYDKTGVPVKYPFGFGLSYTKFDYSQLSVKEDYVSFKVKNTGTVAGAEVAQLYISADTEGMFRPVKELKGFARVALAAGEEKTVSINLNDRSFAVWSIIKNDWVVEPGKYTILVGASCTDIRLGTAIEKAGEPVDNPYSDPIYAVWYTGEVQSVSDGAFKALLGKDIPAAKWDRSRAVEANDTLAQGEYLQGGLGRFIFNAVSCVQKILILLGNKQGANNTEFVLNLTYRTMARFSGFINDNRLSALMAVINREQDGWKRLVESFKEA